MTYQIKTPRTDEMAIGYSLPNTRHGVEIKHYSNKEWSRFARQLELELEESKKDSARLDWLFTHYNGMIVRTGQTQVGVDFRATIDEWMAK